MFKVNSGLSGVSGFQMTFDNGLVLSVIWNEKTFSIQGHERVLGAAYAEVAIWQDDSQEGYATKTFFPDSNCDTVNGLSAEEVAALIVRVSSAVI